MITHYFDTIIGNIPANWRSVELRKLLHSHSAGDWGDEEGDIGVKIIRSTNFTDAGQLDFSDVAVRYFSERGIEKFGLKSGDILLERSGGGPDQPVGRVGFIKSDLGWFWVSNFVQVLRPDAESINSSYLGWILFELQVLPDYLWATCGRPERLTRVAHRVGRAFVASNARPPPWTTLHCGLRAVASGSVSGLRSLRQADECVAADSRMNRFSLRQVALSESCSDSVMRGQISGPSSPSMSC